MLLSKYAVVLFAIKQEFYCSLNSLILYGYTLLDITQITIAKYNLYAKRLDYLIAVALKILGSIILDARLE